MADIWQEIGRIGKALTYGPKQREEERRQQEVDAMQKYREAQLESERARSGYWQSRGTGGGMTAGQQAQLISAISRLIAAGEMTNEEASNFFKANTQYGITWPYNPAQSLPPEPEKPEAPPEKQPGFFGRLFGRGTPQIPSMPNMPPAPTIAGPSLPRKPGDLWVQAPMAGAGYGGQAPTSQAPGSKIWDFLGAPGATNAVAARTPTSPYTLQDPGRPATYEEFRENIKKLNVSNPQKAKDYYEKWSNLWQ